MSKSPREEQIDSILEKLEQVINQLPNRMFVDTLGVMEYTLQHNSEWRGYSRNIYHIVDRKFCTASTFGEICESIGLTLLTPFSAQLLLDAAEEQFKRKQQAEEEV